MFIFAVFEKLVEFGLSCLSYVTRLRVPLPFCLVVLSFSSYGTYEYCKSNYESRQVLQRSATKLRNDIDYVQNRASKDRENLWTIVFSPEGYKVLKNRRNATEKLPSGKSEVVFASNCQISSGLGEVSFDRWGSPMNGRDYKLSLVKKSFSEEVIIYFRTPEFAEHLRR